MTSLTTSLLLRLSALLVLLIVVPRSVIADTWREVCHTPSGLVAGYEFPVAEEIAGECVFSNFVRDPDTKVSTPVVVHTIGKTALAAIKKDLELATKELIRLGLGAPDVPKKAGEYQVRVFPGQSLCHSKLDCCPLAAQAPLTCEAGATYDTVGAYITGSNGYKEMFVSGDGPEQDVSFHELFHSIESRHKGYVSADGTTAPSAWIGEGVAEGFGLHLRERIGATTGVSAGVPAPGTERDFTRALDLSTAGLDPNDLRAYGTGEFWYAVSRLSFGGGDYKFIKTIMAQELMATETGVAGVDAGFKALGVGEGLEKVFLDFTAKYLNVVERHEPKKKTRLNLRASNKDKKEVVLTDLEHLSAKGTLAVIRVKEGQRVEVQAKISKGNDRKLFVALGTETDSRVVKTTIDVCGGAEDIEIPVRIANVSLVKGSRRPTLELQAKVVETDVCSCTPKKLAFGDELIAEQKRSGKPVHTFVRITVGGKTRVMTALNKPRDLTLRHHIRLGEHRHMGKKRYENFERVSIQASVRGLDSRDFYLTFPTEAVSTATCRPLTREEREGGKSIFRAPIDAEFCAIGYAAGQGDIRFQSKTGTIRISQWDKSCWIAGSFNVKDKDGKTASGVFAFDAGKSGAYDVRTKRRSPGRSVKEAKEKGASKR